MAQAVVSSGPKAWWHTATHGISHRRPRPEARRRGLLEVALSGPAPESSFCHLPASTGDCAACDRFPCDEVRNLLNSRQGPLVWLLLALGGDES